MRVFKLGCGLMSLLLFFLMGCQETTSVSSGADSMNTITEEKVADKESGLEEVEVVEEKTTVINKKELEVVWQDVEKYLDQLTLHSGISPLPAFAEISELDVRLMTYIAAVNALGNRESITFTEVDEKVKELFGQQIMIDWDEMKVNPPWRFEVFEGMDELFVVGMGLPFVEFMASILELKEVEAGYEAKVIYFDIDSFEMEVDSQFIYPVILQNGRIVGQVIEKDGTREYQFNVPVEALSVHTFLFDYDEIENLILKSSKIENEFKLVENFTFETACQYAYDYFNVEEDRVIFDQRTDEPYQSMWSNEQFHLVRWMNITPEGSDGGGAGGPLYWISNYGQVYKDDLQTSLPGNRYYKYESEVKFILSETN